MLLDMWVLLKRLMFFRIFLIEGTTISGLATKSILGAFSNSQNKKILLYREMMFERHQQRSFGSCF